MLPIWDFIQQYQLGKTRTQTKVAEARLNQAEKYIDQIDSLPRRFETLALVSQAMWEILSEKFGLSENELLAKVREIDIRDGREDNKKRRVVKKCPGCHRVMNEGRTSCLYCGAEGLVDSVFDTI